jgi:predicted NUDIX family phosphoesterase
MGKVFCINRKNLESVMGSPLPQGTFSHPDIETIMSLDYDFIPKKNAENDDSWKQIIPYQLFSYKNQIFVYKRGKKTGESRLVERYSIGIGGHINSDDFNKEYFLGWINDDTEPVGRVHLGAIHLTVFENMDAIKIKEEEILHFIGRWDIAKILENYSNFETWSALSARHLGGLSIQEYLPFNLDS